MNELLTSRISSEPFRYDGVSDSACYIIHGYTGSTFEMHDIGKFLASNGFTTVGELLPGHGTSVEDCNSKSYQDWIDAVEKGYDQLTSEFQKVFIIGFSMGCTLAFHLALTRNVPGLIIMAPAMFKFKTRKVYFSPIMCHFKEYEVKRFKTTNDVQLPTFGYSVYPLKAGREVLKLTFRIRHQLHKVMTPAIVMHSTEDISAPYENGPRVYDAIGSEDKQFITFKRSSHMLMYDCDKEAVWDATLQFVQDHSKVLTDAVPVPE